MTRLERRYRRLLRVLPRWYRAEREDEMVGTFLADRDDELDLEYGWPGWAEAAAVVALAVRTRLAAKGAPRAVAVGDAVRLVALLGLMAHSALAVGWVVHIGASLRNLPPLTDPDAQTLLLALAGAAATVLAFVMLLTGRRNPARIFAVTALVPGLVMASGVLWPEYVPRQPGALWTAAAANATLWVTVGCLFAGFHRDAPAPPARAWWRAFAIACVVAVVWEWLSRGVFGVLVPGAWLQMFFAVSDALVGWAVIVGAVYLVLRRRAVRRAASWALALVVCAIPGVLVRLDLLRILSRQPADDAVVRSITTATATQLAGLLLVGTVCAVLAVRDLRRLDPPTTPLRTA